ncbi:MAG: D-glycero-alpha-D-manno-heptose 7-phosphate kinase [Elusimicrobia bacterium]|nr:D-glycero-alpha-D-manno-heptose 7-phosphate kinase [Elusimicrobiota bacterium]
MIITRTPLRISIGGGGTDLPSYYSRYGGFVISAAIDQYIYITLHRIFPKKYIVKYSALEYVDEISEIKHPIVREAFSMHKMEPSIEMVSIADIPAGTGLGSSGSFNVGLLRAIYAFKKNHISTHDLAEEACRIEIDRLREPVGKQDQFVAAFGGIICMEISPLGEVNVKPLEISQAAMDDLEDNLLMFFTGYSRSASEVLLDQKTRTENDDKSIIENLHFVKELGYSIRGALEAGDTEKFAKYMHEHWLHKKKRTASISNDNISRWYDLAVDNGALGGKLIGAGGGGFLMFYAKDRVALRKAMKKEGLQEVRFGFDHEGSKVMVIGK